MQQNLRTKLFIAATIYYGICGVSAILTPSAWYFVAAIEPPATDLLLMISGPLFVSLAVGSWMARDVIESQKTMSAVILSASALDAAVILFAVIKQHLALPQGIAFIALDLFWCVAAALILKSLAKQGS